MLPKQPHLGILLLALPQVSSLVLFANVADHVPLVRVLQVILCYLLVVDVLHVVSGEFFRLWQLTKKLVDVLLPPIHQVLLLLIDEIDGGLHASEISRKECIGSHDRVDLHLSAKLGLHGQVLRVAAEELFVRQIHRRAELRQASSHLEKLCIGLH